MERGAKGMQKVARNTSERIGMRPLDLRQQLLASFVACSPSQDHSSRRYRGLMERKAQEGEGGMKLMSGTVTVGLEQVVGEYSWEN